MISHTSGYYVIENELNEHDQSFVGPIAVQGNARTPSALSPALEFERAGPVSRQIG
jgi:hypothetical protein